MAESSSSSSTASPLSPPCLDRSLAACLPLAIPRFVQANEARDRACFTFRSPDGKALSPAKWKAYRKAIPPASRYRNSLPRQLTTEELASRCIDELAWGREGMTGERLWCTMQALVAFVDRARPWEVGRELDKEDITERCTAFLIDRVLFAIRPQPLISHTASDIIIVLCNLPSPT